MSSPLESGALPALYDVLNFLSGLREADEDRVWGRVLEKAAVALACDGGSYLAFLPKMRQLIELHGVGETAKSLSGLPVELGAGIAGWTAKHEEPALVSDPAGDPRFAKNVDEKSGVKTRNILAVPIHDRLELTGVLVFRNKRTGPFSQDDLRLADAVCRLTALTLRNFRLEAMVDKVTSNNASILENLGGGFLAVDMHGRLILCNPSARRILGISPDLPLNLPVEQALRDIPQMAEILVRTASSRQTVKRQEIRWTPPGGQERVLGYSTIMIQDPQGNVSGAGMTFQDITNVKR